MTFVYELDLYYLEMYLRCRYELPTSRLSKVILCQTDRQTESTKIIYHAASWVVSYISSYWCNGVEFLRTKASVFATYVKELRI